MIFLYTFLVLALGALKLFIDRRTARLERKYEQTAKDADRLLREPVFRLTNASKPDLCQSAKRYYQLGGVVQRRDRLEAKYAAWQARADRLGAWVNRLRAWKGRKLPYTFGAVDVSCLLYAIDYLGAGHYLNARALLQQVLALIGR
jgi:hypothetical protein